MSSQSDRQANHEPLAMQGRIDRICLAFENDWKAGKSPRVELFIQEREEPDRSHLLLELLLIELHYRQQVAPAPTLDEYTSRFELDVLTVEEAWLRHQYAAGAQSPAQEATESFQIGERSETQALQTSQADLDAKPTQPIDQQTQDSPAEGTRQLGQYELLEEIGRGGMGVVYLARHTLMNREVALKVLSPEMLDFPKADEKFYQEIRAAAKLTHPNIVSAFDASQADGAYYLVMEYVPGQSLSEILSKEGALPLDTALDYVLQAASGLKYAHEQGIIHRDVKPGNMLITSEGRLKLLDFGLAYLDAGSHLGERSITYSREVLGTVEYLSPEQALDPTAADKRSDIYSLGCTLFRLLTGKIPYEMETTVALILAHREEPVPTLQGLSPQIPQRLEAVVHRMMEKEPEDRYDTMQQVIEAIKSVKEQDVGQQPSRAAFRQRPTSWAQLTRPVPLALAGLVALLIVVAAASFFGNEAPPAASSEIHVIVPQGADGLEVTFRSGEDVLIAGGQRGWKIPAEEGEYVASISKGRDRFQLSQKSVLVRPPVITRLTVLRRTKSLPGNAPTEALAPFDASAAQAHQDAWAKHLEIPVSFENSIGMQFRLIPKGSIKVGRRTLAANKPYYIGTHEVTIAQYRTFVKEAGHRPSKGAWGHDHRRNAIAYSEYWSWESPSYPVSGDHPAGNLVDADCQRFCQWMSRKEGAYYRLPTEVEWEFAARAGTTTRYWTGNYVASLQGAANIADNSFTKAFIGMRPEGGDRTYANWDDGFPFAAPVGSFSPNPFGLYDVHGNATERVYTATGGQKCAGGSFYRGDYYASSSGRRSDINRTTRIMELGFRVVKEIGEK